MITFPNSDYGYCLNAEESSMCLQGDSCEDCHSDILLCDECADGYDLI